MIFRARYFRPLLLVLTDLAACFLAFNLAVDLRYHLGQHGIAPQMAAAGPGPWTAMYLGLPFVILLLAWIAVHAALKLYRSGLSVRAEMLRLAAAQMAICAGLFVVELCCRGLFYSKLATLFFFPIALVFSSGLRLLLRAGRKIPWLETLASNTRRAGGPGFAGAPAGQAISPENVIEVRSASMHYIAYRSRRRSLREAVFRTALRKDERVDVWALRDVSFEVKRGESLGIIGDNGAGKSTLCLLLSKIMAPTSGSVEVDGRVSALLTLGAGFQTDLTGRDNMFLNGVYLGFTVEDMRAKMDEIIEFSELREFIDMPVRTYSSGMRMRLAFSIAASVKPEILIIDELMGVGDRKFQQKSKARMKELMGESKALVVVSHTMDTIRDLCSRAVWLEKGKLIAAGPVEEVIKNYEAR